MRAVAWIFLLVASVSCGGRDESVPELTGPPRFSASLVGSCQTLTLTVPVTTNAHYVQVSLAGPSLAGPSGFDGIGSVFNESGATSVSIPIYVTIDAGAQASDISLRSLLLESEPDSDESRRESRRAEYTQGGRSHVAEDACDAGTVGRELQRRGGQADRARRDAGPDAA